METFTNSYFISSILALTSGLTIVSYKGYATKQGWAMGKLFESDSNLLKIIALLAILGGFIELFFVVSWYMVIIYAIGAWLLSGAFTAMFRTSTQWLSILMLIASVVIWVAGGMQVVNI